MDQLSEFLFQYSHVGVFLALLATGLGLPVPEDIILVTAGVIAEQTASFYLMQAIGMVGVLAGDVIIYALGYRYGEALLQRRPFRWLVTPDRLRKVRTYYRKYGYWAIFVSRYLAGLRATSFLLAGLSHVPFRIFLLADGVAALISVPVFISLGYYFSDNIQIVINRLHEIQGWILAGIAVLVLVVVIVRRFAARASPAVSDET